ncbi:MAG: DUF2156 domain-containing protein [Desulfobulbaceae bacterium]|nr:DUF2156 domain-containing protein [Desulfobulbaceae bacterium]
MPNLLALTLATAPLVNTYLAMAPPTISELTFTNLYVWRHHRPVWFIEIQNTLVFLIRAPHGTDQQLVVFGPPTGALPLATVMPQLGDEVIGAIRQTSASLTGLDHARFHATADRDNFDYVYRVQDLAELAGRRYAAKRNQIKQCLRDNNCTFEMLTAANLDECRGLLERWCDLRHCESDPGLNGEWQALRETLVHFLNFGLLGGVVRLEGSVVAFAIGERLNQETAVCHFEKTLPTIPGLGQLINRWFAAYCLRDFTYVNREQDLGILGLRQAKSSYHPDHLVEKYTISKRR